MVDDESIRTILSCFTACNMSITDFLTYLLQDSRLQSHSLVLEIIKNPSAIPITLIEHPKTRDSVSKWVHTYVIRSHAKSLRDLAKKGTGWHFNTTNATGQQITDFRAEDIAQHVHQNAPELWTAIYTLLSQDTNSVSRQSTGTSETFEDDEDAYEAEFWKDFEDDDSEMPDQVHDTEDIPPPRPWKQWTRAERREAIKRVKATVVVSIMLQSVNQKCNLLQSVFGFFLHSCNTPQKVIQALARMGVSVSVDAINKGVKSLSAEARHTIRRFGKTMRVAYAYDNFDIDFKSNLPTVEKTGSTLSHLTSGTLIRLEHGVTAEHLRCSEELWSRSMLNPTLDTHHLSLPLHTIHDFLALHPESPHPSGLTRHQRFNSWIFYRDLCQHGPQFFLDYQNTVGLPEVVEGIPVVKMVHVPARAMDINQSKVTGNIQAIEELIRQGGVGNPQADDSSMWESEVIDVREHVVLFHGDLGTGERVEALLERRSLEKTVTNRFQFVIFVFGLFHFKMACADALWRIFIEPKHARDDDNSLMCFLAQHRPRETGKIGTKPGFRRMHEVISQEGVALRLNAWQTELSKRFPAWKTLELAAEAKPTPEFLKSVADYLAVNYVAGAGPNVRVDKMRGEPTEVRDQQRENMLLLHKYLLLYEESTHAMNHGDIGLLETTFPPWVAIFKATGKHKYATHILKHLNDVHVRYPKAVCHAVRYNMLVNPTGKPGAFRAPDWVQEHHNLMTKVLFGGRYANYTKKRVIEESSLIDIFHSCHINIERNFLLGGLTSRHTPPDMRRTYEVLGKYMAIHEPNETQPGRTAGYVIPDAIMKGMALLQTTDGLINTGEAEGDNEEVIDDADILGEL